MVGEVEDKVGEPTSERMGRYLGEPTTELMGQHGEGVGGGMTSQVFFVCAFQLAGRTWDKQLGLFLM